MSISLSTLSEIINEIAKDLEKQPGDVTISAEKALETICSPLKQKIFSKVLSSSDKNYYHQVDMEEQTCTCPDYQYRCKGNKDLVCKHIAKAQRALSGYDENFYMDE